MPTLIKRPSVRRRSAAVGPDDHGRRMALADFDRANGLEGWCYELAKGVVEVTNVPKPSHAMQVASLRNQVVVYQETHPDAVYLVAGSNECKVLLEDDQSERHPDLAVYLTAAPDVKDVWSVWVPAIVVEVVSERSGPRDYQDKPPEYLKFGVSEYWIVDAAKGRVSILSRWRGGWRTKILKAGQKYSTPLLPGFSLDLKRVVGVKQ